MSLGSFVQQFGGLQVAQGYLVDPIGLTYCHCRSLTATGKK